MGELSGDESGGATGAVVIEDDDDDDDGSGGDGNNSGGNDQLDGQNLGNQVVSDIPENEDVGSDSDSGGKNGNSGNEPEGEPSPASPAVLPSSSVPATQVVQEPSFAEALLEDSLMFGGDEDDDLPPLPAPPVDPAEDDSEYEKFTPEDKALPFVPSESNSLVNKNTESELRKLQDRMNILKKERTALLLI